MLALPVKQPNDVAVAPQETSLQILSHRAHQHELPRPWRIVLRRCRRRSCCCSAAVDALKPPLRTHAVERGDEVRVPNEARRAALVLLGLRTQRRLEQRPHVVARCKARVAEAATHVVNRDKPAASVVAEREEQRAKRVSVHATPLHVRPNRLAILRRHRELLWSEEIYSMRSQPIARGQHRMVAAAQHFQALRARGRHVVRHTTRVPPLGVLRRHRCVH